MNIFRLFKKKDPVPKKPDRTLVIVLEEWSKSLREVEKEISRLGGNHPDVEGLVWHRDVLKRDIENMRKLGW